MNEFTTLLHENYLVTPMVKHTGSIKFKVLTDGVVVVGLWKDDGGDRRLSGGPWKQEVQSPEKLRQLGWKPLAVELAGGSLYLLARQCKAGEELFLRTRKYHSPRVFVPKSTLPKEDEPADAAANTPAADAMELVRCPNCHKHNVPRKKGTVINCPKCRREIPVKLHIDPKTEEFVSCTRCNRHNIPRKKATPVECPRCKRDHSRQALTEAAVRTF